MTSWDRAGRVSYPLIELTTQPIPFSFIYPATRADSPIPVPSSRPGSGAKAGVGPPSSVCCGWRRERAAKVAPARERGAGLGPEATESPVPTGRGGQNSPPEFVYGPSDRYIGVQVGGKITRKQGVDNVGCLQQRQRVIRAALGRAVQQAIFGVYPLTAQEQPRCLAREGGKAHLPHVRPSALHQLFHFLELFIANQKQTTLVITGGDTFEKVAVFSVALRSANRHICFAQNIFHVVQYQQAAPTAQTFDEQRDHLIHPGWDICIPFGKKKHPSAQHLCQAGAVTQGKPEYHLERLFLRWPGFPLRILQKLVGKGRGPDQ